MAKWKFTLTDVNDLQIAIMEVVDIWASKQKVPIPRKKIIDEMNKNGVKYFTTINAINALLLKGYIRRAVTISNKSSYVQLRRVSMYV